MLDPFTTWLTVQEAIRYSKRGKTTLYAMFKDGTLRPRKLGRRTLVARAEIDAVIERGAAPTAAKATSP
jgi:excisionase family DNA binding protein